MRRVLKNTASTKKRLDSLPKLYGIFLWAKWAILELPWSGEYDETGEPLVYVYYDGNGACDEFHLVPIHYASAGAYFGWYEDKNTADDVRLELNDKLQEMSLRSDLIKNACKYCTEYADLPEHIIDGKPVGKVFDTCIQPDENGLWHIELPSGLDIGIKFCPYCGRKLPEPAKN